MFMPSKVSIEFVCMSCEVCSSDGSSLQIQISDTKLKSIKNREYKNNGLQTYTKN